MSFFTTAVTGLKTVVTAIGAGVAVWGVINLLEGYGNDNPGAKSQGIKQLMAGGGRDYRRGGGENTQLLELRYLFHDTEPFRKRHGSHSGNDHQCHSLL